jgi:hypothetical protein
MRAGFLVGLGLAISFGGGCTTTRTLSVSPSSQTVATSEPGVPCLQSVKANAVTVWLLTPHYRNDPREFSPPAFRVLVRNDGDESFAFSTASIAASSGESPIHVITPEEYRQEVIRRAEHLLRGVEATAAKRLAGEEALREYAQAYAPRTVRGPNGELMNDFSWRDDGSITAAVAGIESEAETQRAAIRARTQRLLGAAPMMLAKTTVAPGLMAGGIVKLEPSRIQRGRPLRLVVAAGGETHEFFFDVGR